MQSQRRPSEADNQKLPGIIDTFGEAFALVVQRPYLALVPVLLDLYLWLGASLSVKPLADEAERWLRSVPNVDAEAIDQVVRFGENFDLFSLLGVSIPTLVGQLGRGAVAAVGDRLWLTDLPWWVIPPLAAALVVTGLIVGTLYLTGVAYLVRAQPFSRRFWRDAGRNAVRMLGFVVITILGAMLLILPVVFTSVLLMVIGINAVPLLVLLAWSAGMWLFFLLFFAQYAIVVSDVGPLRAIYLSYNVVRRNIWGAAGFIVVYFVISNGVPVALNLLTSSPVGVVLAMGGNAFIATGVIAAAMLFYRDRARALGQPGPLSHSPAGPAS